jgi:hypothetical protein
MTRVMELQRNDFDRSGSLGDRVPAAPLGERFGLLVASRV